MKVSSRNIRLSRNVSRRYNISVSSPLFLDRLAAQVQQAVRDNAARHGLLPVQLQVLSFLANANNYSDFALSVSEYLGLTRGTVSQTLAVLERDGFVTKRADEIHGRRVHLDVTEKARVVLGDSWNVALSNRLEAEGSSEAVHAIARIVDALRDLNGAAGFGVCKECSYFQKKGGAGQCGLTGDRLPAAQTVKLCREWAK
jgi:MarR family transcriptional regulator, negative regulator of the multidrug operon emrRAB